MGENLVIVESPAKAKTIEKFLGENYTVKSSFGHIRDLSKKNLGIDIEHGFEPEYLVSDDKKKIVSELKSAAKKSSTVWLASDEDREGEAIAWHLFETLGLKKDSTKRIVFHEITKSAILNAIENPRDIDMNLVMAQQARRVLDRLVGFELSPLLWKKVAPKLSAGRVQSVALKLIVEREREIMAFKSTPFFRITGTFRPEGAKSGVRIKTVYDRTFENENDALNLLETLNGAKFSVAEVEKKEGKRSPAAPFTTSSLQQEASRKLGFSVSQTMTLAQKLYESGFITYMRTDSTNLSSLAIGTSAKYIKENFGEEYSKTRQYKTKSKGAQEAHEAIRPTYIENETISGTNQEKRLYELIWKRTVASQMADAVIDKTDITIKSDRQDGGSFLAKAESVRFDGFLKLYMESHDDEQDSSDENLMLPAIDKDQEMLPEAIEATERFTQKPPRYTEASLVKKLEELGIGRPSTYAPTISTISQRGYIVKGDSEGHPRDYRYIVLENGTISKKTLTENTGVEKAKLFPQDIGMMVTDFLNSHFKNIIDYGFTAKIEKEFDRIAEGKAVWNNKLSEFYQIFHTQIEETLRDASYTNSERIIGTDPASGKTIKAKIGKFGPYVQKGENDDPDKQYVSLKKGQLIESITLEEALNLFKLPRTVGAFEGENITAAIGRFGPYIKFGKSFVSLGKTHDPYTITEEEAVELIKAHREKEANKHIKSFEYENGTIEILNGRFGPYIKYAGNNYKIPKGSDTAQLDLESCIKIITEAGDGKSSQAKKRKSTGSKKKSN